MSNPIHYLIMGSIPGVNSAPDPEWQPRLALAEWTAVTTRAMQAKEK